MTEPSPAESGSSPEAARARCRHCGARLRPDAAWCPLCHTAVTDDPATPAAQAPGSAAVAPGATGRPGPVPAARTGSQDDATPAEVAASDDGPADDAPAGRARRGSRTKGQAKAHAQARARARAKGLIAAPVLPRDGQDVEDDAPSRPELSEEKIDELLAKLAASESTPDPASMFGPLGALHGRAGGLALPIVLGAGLLVVGLVVVAVLGLVL